MALILSRRWSAYSDLRRRLDDLLVCIVVRKVLARTHGRSFGGATIPPEDGIGHWTLFLTFFVFYYIVLGRTVLTPVSPCWSDRRVTLVTLGYRTLEHLKRSEK
jgi:hypothetical protein